jgi:hypothetical protein
MTNPSVVAVAETSDEVEANIWADALRDDGLMTEIVTLGTQGALGGGVMFPGASYRLLVNGDDVSLARQVIADLGGSDRLRHDDDDVRGNPMRIVWLMAAVIVLFFGAGLLLKVLAS